MLTPRGLQSTKFMLGIITAVIASNWLGDLVHSDGIYESDLEADGSVVYLRQTAPSSLGLKPAKEIMSSETWCAWLEMPSQQLRAERVGDRMVQRRWRLWKAAQLGREQLLLLLRGAELYRPISLTLLQAARARQ